VDLLRGVGGRKVEYAVSHDLPEIQKKKKKKV